MATHRAVCDRFGDPGAGLGGGGLGAAGGGRVAVIR
jgi:hypothetical protein